MAEIKKPDFVAYGKAKVSGQAVSTKNTVEKPDFVAYGKQKAAAVNTATASKQTNTQTPAIIQSANERLEALKRAGAVTETGVKTAQTEGNGETGLWNRLKNMTSGAVKSLGASYTNVGGMAAEGAGKWNTRISNYTNKDTLRSAQEAVERYQAMLDSGKWADGRTMTAADRKQVQSMLAANQRKLTAQESYTNAVEASDKAVADQAYQTADRLAESSAQDLATAKEGLGKVGQFAVDLGSQGVQMAGDIAASALIPGSGLVLMGARSAGSAAQEARQSGATYGQQLAYGLGSGAVSIATEKLSSVAAPFKKAFGGGVLDEALSKAVSKMSGSAAGKAVLSMLSEGGEEAVEDLVQPILQRMTYDKDALSQYGDSDYWAQMLYDGLVGAAMGGIGSGVEAVQNRITSKNATGNAAGTQTAAQEGNIHHPSAKCRRGGADGLTGGHYGAGGRAAVWAEQRRPGDRDGGKCESRTGHDHQEPVPWRSPDPDGKAEHRARSGKQRQPDNGAEPHCRCTWAGKRHAGAEL